MKRGEITEHQLERIVKAVNHNIDVTQLYDETYAVSDGDSESEEDHVVHTDDLYCSCGDYEYNCGAGQYCKHVYAVVFYTSGLLTR